MLYSYAKLWSMMILDVIPLISLPRSQPGTVSYFHSDALERGTVVQVLYNNRKIKAVVVRSDDIRKRKEMLKKQATFTLKSITKVLVKEPKITEDEIKKAQEISEYYYSPLGLTLKTVLAHPEEKNPPARAGLKKYLAPGTSRIAEALDDYIPEMEELQGKFHAKIVDMRKEIRDANYSIFSRALKEALQVAQEENKKTVIFIPRRGFANLLTCQACGHTFKCPNCSASLIVHEHMLVCHHCNYGEDKPKTCPNCKSYNLKPYGVGIEKVEAELLKFFNYQNLKKPDIQKLSSESPTLPESWDILLTTQSIFKYREVLPKIAFLGIMNADALIHIPDYRAEEKLFRQTYLLGTMTNELIVQTYNPEDPALVAAAANDIKGFWETELTYREQLKYPPNTQLVKLTSRHRSREMLQRNATNLASYLKGVAYPALIDRERGMYVWNILLRFSKEIDIKKRNETLRQVPPDWTVDVDPLTIV